MENRYSRQTMFSPIGSSGQKQLSVSRVLVMGAGALGSAVAETLVRAGVGELTIIDRDVVEASNLPRQNLYTEHEAQTTAPKAMAAKERLQKINQQTTIHAYVLDADAPSLEKIVQDHDVLIDGSDNFDIRFVLNDLSQKYGIPWIFGASAGSFGMSCTFLPGDSPCLQCLLQGMPEGAMTCSTSGIIAPAVQMTAAYQTTEAMKILTDNRESLLKKLILFDIWKGQHQEIGMYNMKKHDCSSCGSSRSYPYLTERKQSRFYTLCGQEAVQIRPSQPSRCDFAALEQHLLSYGKVKRNEHVLTCLFSSYRLTVFSDGRMLIHGTSNTDEAKAIYDYYLPAPKNMWKKEQEQW